MSATRRFQGWRCSAGSLQGILAGLTLGVSRGVHRRHHLIGKLAKNMRDQEVMFNFEHLFC
jgi:hypothetical protein